MLRVADSYFDTSIPEHTIEIKRDQMIEPEVGVAVESQDGEKLVLDPGQHVEDLVDRLMSGEELEGLPEWAYHAVLGRLEEFPFIKRGDRKVRAGLRKTGDGGVAVLCIALEE